MTKEIEIFNPIKERFIEIVNEKAFAKEVSFAIQHIKNNSQLIKATQQSKQKAVLNVAQVGLTLNPVAKEAYLIPRFISFKDEQGKWQKRVDCCLEPSYVGLVKLLTDAGSVTSLNTQIVYDGDLFDMDLANATITHKPYFLNKKEKGKIIGVYSIAVLKTGERQPEFMDIETVYEIRDRSESYKAYQDEKIKSCVWISDETEMIRKTIIRRIYKYLPRTERMEQVDRAIDLDNQDYKPSIDKIMYLKNLMRSSVLPDNEKQSIEEECNIMNNNRANELIQHLQNNQMGFKEGVVNTQTINEELQNK